MIGIVKAIDFTLAMLAAGAIGLLIAGSLAGCIHSTPAQIVDKSIAVGGDVLVCAADDASNVETAIRDGGASWIGAVIGLFHCIPQVVRDIEAKEAIAEAMCPGETTCAIVASTSTGVDPKYTRLSRGAKRRLASAKVLGRLLNGSVKP